MFGPMHPPSPAPAYLNQRGDGTPDQVLVGRIAAGDERALGELFDRWQGVVGALATRMLGDADDADDVVEDTFWQVWREAGRFEAKRGSAKVWLLTIARSRALDRVRARGRRREERVETDDGFDAAAASSDTALEGDASMLAEQSEERRIVLAALGELPPEQRKVLELAYYGGLSQAEIAEKTGEPLGTIKTRVRLAMQKLRDSLRVLERGTA